MNSVRNIGANQKSTPRILARNVPTDSSISGRSVSSLRTSLPLSREASMIVTLPDSKGDTPEEIPKRRGGGRGREWMGRCHRLIQAMLELEESEPFRDPVNELLFPDYSTCVEKHMDLSRVMMNLHSGLYATPSAFDADIKLIFSNWKKYIKDPSSVIFSQLYKLSWWYNREFTSLVAEVADKFSGRCLATTKVNMGNGKAKAQFRKITLAGNSPTVKRKRTEEEMDNQSAAPGDDFSIGTPPASRFSWTTLSGTATSSSQDTNVVAKLPAHTSVTSAALASTSTSRTLSSVSSSGSNTTSNPEDSLSMSLDVTNIWLGSTRVRPLQPVLLSETGLEIYLAPNSDFRCSTLIIPKKDIVRAVGHLKKSKKHSLFIFVTPLIEKEMRSLYKGNPMNLSKSKVECFSLVTVFVKALSMDKVSKLIHIFWNMSRDSIFGQLFSETDQLGALTILASIKPNIMHRVAEKQNESEAGSPNSDPNTSGKNNQPVRTVARKNSNSTSRNHISHNLNESGTSNSSSAKSQANDSAAGVASSSRDQNQDDVGNTSNGVSVDDEDLEIVDPSEAIGDAAMEAMLADEDDLVMMSTVINTKCPITQLTMMEPVKNKHCSHTYDKQGVHQLIVNRGKKAKCPVPGCKNDLPLEMVDMEKDSVVEEELLKNR